MEPGNPGCVQYVLVGEGGQLTPLGPLLQVTFTLMLWIKGPLCYRSWANNVMSLNFNEVKYFVRVLVWAGTKQSRSPGAKLV